jgi:hypothetical protein
MVFLNLIFGLTGVAIACLLLAASAILFLYLIFTTKRMAPNVLHRYGKIALVPVGPPHEFSVSIVKGFKWIPLLFTLLILCLLLLTYNIFRIGYTFASFIPLIGPFITMLILQSVIPLILATAAILFLTISFLKQKQSGWNGETIVVAKSLDEYKGVLVPVYDKNRYEDVLKRFRLIVLEARNPRNRLYLIYPTPSKKWWNIALSLASYLKSLNLKVMILAVNPFRRLKSLPIHLIKANDEGIPIIYVDVKYRFPWDTPRENIVESLSALLSELDETLDDLAQESVDGEATTASPEEFIKKLEGTVAIPCFPASNAYWQSGRSLEDMAEEFQAWAPVKNGANADMMVIFTRTDGDDVRMEHLKLSLSEFLSIPVREFIWIPLMGRKRSRLWMLITGGGELIGRSYTKAYCQPMEAEIK